MNTTMDAGASRKAFGAAILSLREDLGLTQAGLAEHVGVTKTMISFVETGVDKRVARETLDRIIDLAPAAEQEDLRFLAAAARLSSGASAEDFARFVHRTSQPQPA